MNSKISQLKRQANQFQDHNPKKMQLFNQALQLAQQQQNLKEEYDIRLQIVETATFSGHQEKIFPHFGWCVSQYEQHSDQLSLNKLLWKYKYVLESAGKFHTITREQIDHMHKMMEKHYQQGGYSMRPVLRMLGETRYFLGEQDKSLDLLQQGLGHRRDRYADCQACEITATVRLLTVNGQYQQALELAEPIMNGDLGCAEVPHLTYTDVLPALMALGHEEVAQQCLERGYRLINDNPGFIAQVGMQIKHCAKYGLIDAALKRFELHLDWWLGNHCHWDQFEFELGVAKLFSVIDSEEVLSLNLPQAFELFDENSQYRVGDLLDYFQNKLVANAKAFDQRNGNGYFSERAAELI